MTLNSLFKIVCLDWSILGASICEEMFRINPARLVYLKFRATIAKGIAGNNVPTAAIVVPISKKYFHLESINLQHFLVTDPPLAGEVPEGKNVFTE